MEAKGFYVFDILILILLALIFNHGYDAGNGMG
jgi:hypothetical protein